MPVERITGANGGNGSFSIPTQDNADRIIMTTIIAGTDYPVATAGWTTVTLIANVGLNDVCRGRVEWRTVNVGSTTIPSYAGSGSPRRIADVYRGLSLGPLPLYQQEFARSDVAPGDETNLRFIADTSDPGNDHDWIYAIAILINDALDSSDAPPGLTKRQTTSTGTIRLTTYDSNDEDLETLYIGPEFASNHRWATLSWHMVPFPAGRLVQNIETITLESEAQLARFAVLTQNIEDITLEADAFLERQADLVQNIEDIWLVSTAHIPPSTEANLESNIFITVNSTAHIEQPDPIICTPDPAPIINGCVTVVNHAVYTSFRLYDALQNALFPAIRESNPMTAFDTMDDWLDRLNWVDCMGACRVPGINGVLPTEIIGECGSYVAVLDYPTCLTNTIKHGIISALTKLQYGRTKNLCTVNDIISDLGAAVYPTPGQEDECPHKMNIAPTTNNLPTWQRMSCDAPLPSTCLAYYEPTPLDPPGLPTRIYPGLMAAECIVRSMFNQHRFIDFNRLVVVPPSIPSCSSMEM